LNVDGSANPAAARDFKVSACLPERWLNISAEPQREQRTVSA
jgi:hypothetical protein